MKAQNSEQEVSKSLQNTEGEKTLETPQVFEKREVKPIRYTLQLKKDAGQPTPEEELYIINILYGKKCIILPVFRTGN